MKSKLVAALLFFSCGTYAQAECSNLGATTSAARNAVKALISLSDLPHVIAYWGGVQKHENGYTVLTVQPHYEKTKDWYKVTVRNSDCRVMDTVLIAENMPLK